MRWLALLLALVATLALAGPAGAVLSGENGRIVFVSGREVDDNNARGYLLQVPSNTAGGGTLSSPFTPPASGQFRHPTWSPDRTKIAYANGPGPSGPFDIFVQDLVANTLSQVTPTETPVNLSDDRPAWSPDGTRLAYEHEPAAASTDRHIRVQSALDLSLPVTTTDLTTAGAPFEGKPAWSPDSTLVYFHRNDPSLNVNADVYRKPAAGGAETLVLTDTGNSEAQPSISPDGNRICYTRTSGGFNSSAEVLVASLATLPATGNVVSQDGAAADYNCTWSPDGEMIAYVNGQFSNGRLVMLRADDTSPDPIVLAQDDQADGPDFDGNPDWAPDARPDCPDSTFTTQQDTPVSFSLTCTDTGPLYERSIVSEVAYTNPLNGTLAQDVAGGPFTYMPTESFSGTDSFYLGSFDAFGFGTDAGKITIKVQEAAGGGGIGGGGGGAAAEPLCAGRTATIVGTAVNNRLTGTSGNDVIVGLGGNDTIRGGGGNDVICAGDGNDRVGGGSGNDRAAGGNGDDIVSGDGGRDSLKGDAGNDVIRGGSGRDAMNGGTGSDRLSGGSARDLCRGGGGRDRGTRCERRSSIP